MNSNHGPITNSRILHHHTQDRVVKFVMKYKYLKGPLQRREFAALMTLLARDAESMQQLTSSLRRRQHVPR